MRRVLASVLASLTVAAGVAATTTATPAAAANPGLGSGSTYYCGDGGYTTGYGPCYGGSGGYMY
jgi:hypothetical protein